MPPGGAERVVEGDARPVIREQRGSGGFGYDVVFVPDGRTGRSPAEMPPEEKDLISHRGKSLRAIAPAVVELLGS